jgi:hypothetical protein
MLGLIRYNISSFSTAHSLCVSCTTPIRSKLKFASFARNSITLTDSSKHERVQRTFAALCSSRFLSAYVAIIMKVF